MTTKRSRRGHAALPFDAWPEADRTAWTAAIRPGGFLQPGGRGAAWRPASLQATIGAYGRWLVWLAAQEPGACDEASARRLTPQRVARYARFLLDTCASVTAAGAMGIICMAVIAMFPEEEWEWLRTIQRALKRQAVPIRAKRFAPADQLSQLGLELMAEAETLLAEKVRSSSPSRARLAAARQFRDGLMIALLAARPLRIKNFVGIEIGTHLIQTATQTTIRFTEHETKTHRSIHQAWPTDLLPGLVRYLKEIRPLLIAAPATGGNARYAGNRPVRGYGWVRAALPCHPVV